MTPKVHEYISGQIWLCAYPVKYLGMRFHARMTIIRLADGKLMLHSPCEVDDLMRPMLGEIGEVAYIVAPGTFHHMHVASAQAAFPEAKTFICPGLESKRPSMRFDFLLGDVAPAAWVGQFDRPSCRQSLDFGGRVLSSRDQDADPGRSDRELRRRFDRSRLALKLWWRLVLHMWNTPRPAPEYQLGWSTRELHARRCRAFCAGISSASSSRMATSLKATPSKWSRRLGKRSLPPPEWHTPI